MAAGRVRCIVALECSVHWCRGGLRTASAARQRLDKVGSADDPEEPAFFDNGHPLDVA